jgi:hypothetical protein
MTQVSWRAQEELVERCRAEARQRGRSLNEFMTSVLDAATNPDLAGSEAERVRGRLAAAGLLVQAPSRPDRPDPAKVAAARSRAGQGAALSDVVSAGR